MRRVLAAAAVACAAGSAAAQFGTATGGFSTSKAGGGGAMPGQTVGTGFNLAGSTPQPIGKHQPAVGDPLTRPYDPSKPLDQLKGTGIDAKNVIAPISAFPPVPGPDKNLVDRLYDKLDSALSVNFFARKPEPVARPANVTPSIFRRNRDRVDDRMWRRD